MARCSVVRLPQPQVEVHFHLKIFEHKFSAIKIRCTSKHMHFKCKYECLGIRDDIIFDGINIPEETSNLMGNIEVFMSKNNNIKHNTDTDT